MTDGAKRGPGPNGQSPGKLTRRELLKLSLTGSALACLDIGCGNSNITPYEPPPGPPKTYKLSDGQSLYDDFDGSGGLQTYDEQNLAVAGALSHNLWVGKPEDAVVSNPFPGPGVVPVRGAGGYVLKITNSMQDFTFGNFVFLMLDHPTIIEFVDYKTFSADMLLSSASTVEAMSAKLDYHTTIPEQFSGRSWAAGIGIRKRASGEVYLFATAYNVNTDYRYNVNMGPALLDQWYNLRLDVVTNNDDVNIPVNQLRLDYYVNGVLIVSEIPIDAEILIDPARTGGGPNRSLIVSKEAEFGDAVAYFDNIKAVYTDRIS
jgi:hypothetical protein